MQKNSLEIKTIIPGKILWVKTDIPIENIESGINALVEELKKNGHNTFVFHTPIGADIEAIEPEELAKLFPDEILFEMGFFKKEILLAAFLKMSKMSMVIDKDILDKITKKEYDIILKTEEGSEEINISIKKKRNKDGEI